MSQRFQHAGAALLLLLAVLFVFRAVLPDIGGRLPLPERHETRRETLVYQADQGAVAGMIGLKASRMAALPFGFAEKSSCFPLTRPYTLGEHMFGEALLGIVPHALTGNPITTFNIVVILHLWVAGLAMYALAYFWTGSIPGALVAALLFALHPLRAANPAHLFATGNIWTPLALLAAHRLMHSGSWRAAAALSAMLVLQLLESFYQVLGLAILGGVYGGDLLWRHRAHLLARLPQLAMVATITLGTLFLLFQPYFHARDTWNILQGREDTILLYAADYWPGGDAGIGVLALLLALVGLADRIRRQRIVEGTDPRLPLLAAAAAVFLCSVATIPGLNIPGPIHLLREVVPGLDGIRVLRSIAVGVLLVVDLLAAYGILVLLELLPSRLRLATGCAAVALVFAELTHPVASAFSFGRNTAMGHTEAGIPAELASLYTRIPEGAVLDLPAHFGPWRKVADGPIYLTAAGFHGQPVAACYNSFSTYVQKGIEELAAQLPAPEAADALHALGFRTLALHQNRGDSRELRRLRKLITDPTRMRKIGQAGEVSLYALQADIEITEDASQIQATATFHYAHPLTKARQWIPIHSHNASNSVFRHPEPIEPRPAIIIWRNTAGEAVSEGQAFAYLPLALGPGAETGRGIEIDVPTLPPGFYNLHVSLADHPNVILGRTRVILGAGAGVALPGS